METFNNKLEVGMLAMVIGVNKPENTHLIGSVVTVEGFTKPGDDVKRFFDIPDDIELAPVKIHSVVVSNCNVTGSTVAKTYSMLAGHAFFDEKHLMPLPPLKEEQRQKELELCY